MYLDISAWSSQKPTRKEGFPAREPSHLPASLTDGLHLIYQLLNGMCISVRLQRSLVFENERKCVIPGSCHSGSTQITHLATVLSPQQSAHTVWVWGANRDRRPALFLPFPGSLLKVSPSGGPFPDPQHVDSPSLTL